MNVKLNVLQATFFCHLDNKAYYLGCRSSNWDSKLGRTSLKTNECGCPLLSSATLVGCHWVDAGVQCDLEMG